MLGQSKLHQNDFAEKIQALVTGALSDGQSLEYLHLLKTGPGVPEIEQVIQLKRCASTPTNKPRIQKAGREVLPN